MPAQITLVLGIARWCYKAITLIDPYPRTLARLSRARPAPLNRDPKGRVHFAVGIHHPYVSLTLFFSRL